MITSTVYCQSSSLLDQVCTCTSLEHLNVHVDTPVHKTRVPPSLVPRLSPQKRGGGGGGGEERAWITSAGKVVDFRHLALAVPIRLQNETTCTCDILSTQQNIEMNL